MRVGLMHCVSCGCKQVLPDCPERRKRVLIPSARANLSGDVHLDSFSY